MKGLFQCERVDKIKEVVMICWSLLKARNELVWNQKSISAVRIFQLDRVVLNQW